MWPIIMFLQQNCYFTVNYKFLLALFSSGDKYCIYLQFCWLPLKGFNMLNNWRENTIYSWQWLKSWYFTLPDFVACKLLLSQSFLEEWWVLFFWVDIYRWISPPPPQTPFSLYLNKYMFMICDFNFNPGNSAITPPPPLLPKPRPFHINLQL